ncbi:hypothetical protein [uncultured Cloacibacillus sp.]|uniref:hypothetical protein n=1 Tax=uncultured Cloacibacillus sp. TaxID=889794 RepID=UPI003208C9A7
MAKLEKKDSNPVMLGLARHLMSLNAPTTSEFKAAGFRVHRQNADDMARPALSGVSNMLKIFRFVRWGEQRIASSAE